MNTHARDTGERLQDSVLRWRECTQCRGNCKVVKARFRLPGLPDSSALDASRYPFDPWSWK